MQTPAERYLIAKTAEFLRADYRTEPLRLLSIGAGRSVVIENAINDGSFRFVCDRIDICDCAVDHPTAGRSWVVSIEDAAVLETAAYDLAFANFVLEHVEEIGRAAAQISRVLKPGGHFVASLPNPQAPEFRLSRVTPLRFHQFIKGTGEGKLAHETHYVYGTPRDLVRVFGANGLELVDTAAYAFTRGYLYRFPLLGPLSRLYDGAVDRLGIKPLMGNLGFAFQKVAGDQVRG